MAQGYYEGYQPPHTGRIPPAQAASGAARMGRMVNFAGAALSVALVAGVGVWSYRLMVRDVTGVPVIRALAGPIRISPEDPGGRQAAYQGLSVNTVAAEGGAAGAAQTIALAPAPQSLTAEDRSNAALGARAQAPIVAPSAITAMQTPPVVPGSRPAPLPEDVTQIASVDPTDILPTSTPGLARSPIPRPRSSAAARAAMLAVPAAATTRTAVPGSPDAQAEQLLQELVTRLGAPRVTDIDPDTLSPGTRLVQLGVYDDEAGARAAWDSINARFPSFLDSRGRIVEPATSGGRVFYRLRAAGFQDEPEARRFCTMLLAESVDCIPTLIR
ncbi:MAG: SPOR domain-containing protein [Rhodobacteraceae bacterium]|nr:SPOR domain-containing protein [Paracoccaceae bacterium]